MNKEIEEAIRKCNLYIQGGVMHLVDCNSKGQLVFKGCDTSAIETVLNYIKEIEKENKNIKDTDLTSVYLKGVYDGQEKIITKIRKRIKELKNKSGGNVFHIQQTINAEIRLLEEILKEEEK